MARPVDVSVVIDRDVETVWDEVAVIERHIDWMADAAEIRFLTARREGVGTRFECDTRVGPLTTTDIMEITSWDVGHRIGVRHQGAVTGIGEFTLSAVGDSRTRFRWREQLQFPWYFGASIGAFVARPVLHWIWRRNLRGLKSRLECPLHPFSRPAA